MLEKKRARRENDRAFRTMGIKWISRHYTGDSFRDQLSVRFLTKHIADIYNTIARQDTTRKRFEEKRAAVREETVATARSRAERQGGPWHVPTIDLPNRGLDSLTPYSVHIIVGTRLCYRLIAHVVFCLYASCGVGTTHPLS